MNELLSESLWSRIRELSEQASRRKAAVAYVTDIQNVKFGFNDVLVTDASDSAIKSGQTDAGVLVRAFEDGAKIHSVSNLHTKVYVFDHVAVIGSANLSRSSEHRLVEAAWITDQPPAVSGAHRLIEGLIETAVEVNGEFLARAEKLPVTKRDQHQRAIRRRPQTSSLEGRHRTWLVGIGPLSKEFPDEEAIVERGVESAHEQFTDESNEVFFIRYHGKNRFRREATRGDSIILIWSNDSTEKEPAAVYRHAAILNREDDEGSTYFFLEDSDVWNDSGISWDEFRQLASKVGIRFKLGQWMCRELPEEYSNAIHELWESS